jgi:predicted nucleotidyltransferase
MAQLDVMMQKRTQIAITVVSRFTRVVCTYLFGSQVDGTADQWSDIDLAVFIEGLESWDLHDRARIAVQVQKEAGDDIEVHFLPAETLTERDPAGFAAWVLTHGVQLPA